MNRYPCVLILLAAVATALVLPATALAVEIYHFRDKSAWADFYLTDPTSCISTSVYVFATESRSQNPPGVPTDSAVANVSIFQWNNCTNVPWGCMYGSVSLPDDAFSMDGNLASATLNPTTIAVYECTTGNDPQPVSITMTWTGEGDVFHGTSDNSYHYPGHRESYRAHGQSHDATASGSITFGGATLALQDGGLLGAVNSGTIYHD